MSLAIARKTDIKYQNRYPGLRPFIRSDNIIFFGRNTETEQLLDSIRVNQTFIVFGKSGLGKSSLINAGIVPRLIAENYYPITIRFYNAKDDPHNIVKDELKKIIGEGNSTINSKVMPKDTLSVLLSRWNKEQNPVFIFDQFEEFFYYELKKRESLINELAFIVNNEVLTEAEAGRRQPAFVGKKIDIKLLFIIRSDRLNLMNEISEKIPGIFNNRFQLKPLQKEKAEQATVLPAQIQDIYGNQVVFKTQPYEYTLETIQLILSELSNKEGEIESSQLQIICQELEEIACNKNSENKTQPINPDGILIDVKDFHGKAGIKEILNKFYWKQLEKLASDPGIKALEKSAKEYLISSSETSISSSAKRGMASKNYVVSQVRILIENELVSGTKRVIQSEIKVKEFLQDIHPFIKVVNGKDKVDLIIDKLLDLRLIREEESHLGKVYEISHDTLLESIINARNARKKKENDDKLKVQQKLLIEQKQKTTQEEKLKDRARNAKNAALKEKRNAELATLKSRKNLRYAIFSLVSALLFAAAFIYLYVNLRKEKNRNQHRYARLLTFTAAQAYGDNNHALAFNLAREADKLLDDKNHITDSFLSKWDLYEYSGQDVQTSLNEKTIACQYKNSMLQVFKIRDTLRSNNPSVIFSNANDFTLSQDGSAVAIIDTVTKTLRFYRLYNANKDFDTTLLWSQNFTTSTNVSGLRLMNGQYLLASNGTDSLQIYDYLYKQSLPIKYEYWDNINDSYLAKAKLYVNKSNENKVVELNFINGQINLIDDSKIIFDYTDRNIAFLYNSKKKMIYRFYGDIYRPVINVAGLSENFDLNLMSQTDSLYILGQPDRYFFIKKINKIGSSLPSLFNQPIYSLPSLVWSSRNQVMYISNDSLAVMNSTGTVTKKPIAYSKNLKDTTLLEQFNDFLLSASGSKVFCTGHYSVVIIDLLPSPVVSVLYENLTSGYFKKLQTLDLFIKRLGLVSYDKAYKDISYWENYYEPLDKDNIFGATE